MLELQYTMIQFLIMSIKLKIILKATEIERRGEGISVYPRFQLFQEDNFK